MYYKNPLTYLIPLLFIILFITNLAVVQEQQFTLLAQSFISHHLDIVNIGDDISDTAYFNGKYFWPLGPFPAIILLPFVIFYKDFPQSYISFPLSVLNFYLLFKIAKHFRVNTQKALLLATFFVFGSIYTPVAGIPGSWYFAQTVATTLTIVAIYEFLTKRRLFLIGLLLGAAVATRFNIIFAAIFFIPYLIGKSTIKNVFLFFLPIAISLSLLGIYNYSRFQNPLEHGYNLQLIVEEPRLRRDKGLFSITHLPANLYYMVLKGPDPIFLNSSHILKPPFVTFDSYGLSIFFLSPILFLLYKSNLKDKQSKMAALTSIILLIPILTYYGIGQRQVGFRYALDLFPFLYLLLIDPVQKTGLRTLYILIFFGVFFSIFFTFNYLNGIYTSP